MEDAVILLLRVVVGGLIAGHGAQKAWGWFLGRAGAVAAFEKMGFSPAGAFVTLAGYTQVLGGVLFGIGLWSPAGAMLIVGSSVQAIRRGKGPNGLWIQQDGAEYLIVLTTVALGVGLIGPGALSVDGALGWEAPAVLAGAALLAAALGGWLFPRRLRTMGGRDGS